MQNTEDKATILVVDDDKAITDFISILLKDSGYTCYTASKGEEALEKAEKRPPDIIYLNFFIPGISGIEVCKKLKSNPVTSSIPVIMIASLDHDIRNRCLEACASDFITKPLNPIEITEKTRNFLLIKKYTKIVKKHTLLEQALKSIEKAKKEWEQTVDCIDDIIILIDRNDRICRTNKTLSAITNLQFTDLLGRKWQEILKCNDFTHLIFDSGDIEFFHSSNRYFNYNIYNLRDYTANNHFASVIILQDITELKQLTQKLEENSMMLQKKNQELEKAYSELKSAQSQLLQQEKMASIGQLAAGVAHEINNPTGFIMSNMNSLSKYSGRIKDFIAFQTETLQSALKDLPNQKDYLERLEEKRKTTKFDHIMDDIDNLINESIDGAERIKRIVTDLKGFSRIDEAEYKPSDINAGLERTINLLWNELKYKASIKKEYGNVPKIKCNAGQLQQVFMNILLNALQSIEKQGEIKVRTWHEADNIFISISDTGCGIPADKINRIFEPFFTTKEVGQGTGLGLSIVYDIISKHNGDIKVDSNSGIGTTFTIRIPAID